MTHPSPQLDPSRADASGELAGEYLLLRKLGEGGCGAVYEAEHPLLQRRAAVKVLHRAPSVGSSGLTRFVAEAKTVNQIRSRHIVGVFSFGELTDGRPFYVMDLLEGEPLDRYLARVGKLGIAAALRIAKPIADALDAAHAAGIVHRDLKPQNIFLALEPDGEVVLKLLDFGIAKLLHDGHALTLSGAVIGTPLYMSPEQARGESVDARSDVYSLGVLCYELLTGELPLRGATMLGVAMAHLTEVPRPPSLVGGLPAALDAPLLRMLAKRAADRPASAGAALQALAAAAVRAGLPIAGDAEPMPRPEPLPPRTRSLPTTIDAEPSPELAHSVERPRLASLAPLAPSAPAQGARRVQALFAFALLVAALALGALLVLRTAPSAPRARPAAEPARAAAIAPARSDDSASTLAQRALAPPAREPAEPLGSASAADAGVDRSVAASDPPPKQSESPAPPSARSSHAARAVEAARASGSRAAPRVSAPGRARESSIPRDLENPF